MDVIKLRKLTGKSVLGFGQFGDCSIYQLLGTKSRRSYLRWVYFNSSKITFIDEILDELRIPEDLRFEKPGTNPDNYRELLIRWTEEIESTNGVLRKILDNSYKAKKGRLLYKNTEGCFETKGQLKARNHGKR